MFIYLVFFVSSCLCRCKCLSIHLVLYVLYEYVYWAKTLHTLFSFHLSVTNLHVTVCGRIASFELLIIIDLSSAFRSPSSPTPYLWSPTVSLHHPTAFSSIHNAPSTFVLWEYAAVNNERDAFIMPLEWRLFSGGVSRDHGFPLTVILIYSSSFVPTTLITF